MTINNNKLSVERKIKGSVLEHMREQGKKFRDKEKLKKRLEKRKDILKEAPLLLIKLFFIVSLVMFVYFIFFELKELYLEGSITRCDHNEHRYCDRIRFNPNIKKWEDASYEIISLEQAIGEDFISSFKFGLFMTAFFSIAMTWEYFKD